ncbi:6-phosphogluconolactonase [Bianquea renquensis]|jgi:glucosamine-6-phosphate isomerase NAGB|uniref:6-phosphogluconolactonase n=1 Tax=Bianquea renquensis TaxID=2763661 RepID=A0A926DT52_9FIRM|nr:6-phosphogluconolactonase [Bianquea renquensis]MBC8543581.1 6-phosphogluconolactonase [Bianquea renquensis]
MEIFVCKDSKELGQKAAQHVGKVLRECIQEKGEARIVLSTGASQLDTLEALIQENVDWSKVEMFHLDEYVDLPETHIASFRKYLKERFISKVNLKGAYLVDGDLSHIPALTEKLREKVVDVGLIGIGENAHIAFNDPPADFDTQDAYLLVNLNDTCKQQQVREGWFKSVEEVPKQAISMSVSQIMKCKRIVSCVPYAVKAKAIYDTLNNHTTNTIPATILKEHEDFTLFLDQDSASMIQ